MCSGVYIRNLYLRSGDVGILSTSYTCLRRVLVFRCMRTAGVYFLLSFTTFFSLDDFTCPLVLALGFATFLLRPFVWIPFVLRLLPFFQFSLANFTAPLTVA